MHASMIANGRFGPYSLTSWRLLASSSRASRVSTTPASPTAPTIDGGQHTTPVDTGESALSGTAPTEALHTFTLDSGPSRSFFRDSTTLTPLSQLVAISLADPSGGPVLAHSSTVLPCPAALSGLHLPSISTILVSGADLQDAWVDHFTPGGQHVTHSTCSQTGRHLATFTRWPGSSLYTLTIASPPIATSGQVAASGQVFSAASTSTPEFAPCSCRPLSHETLLWHHRVGHPSLPRLRGMASRTLVSGLPQSLPPFPPGPAPTCVPCVEGWQRAAPHSPEFPLTEAPLQTLHMDVWGPAHVHGQGHERYFLLVVDDYSRYTTVFPLRSKGDVTEVLIDWIRSARRQLSESFGSDLPVLRLHSDRGGEFSSDLLRAFCRAEGIRQTFTLPASPQQNGIAECRIGMVMDVSRMSMIHAAAPHFLWPFAVQYAAHQINLQPRGPAPSGVSQVDPVEPVEVAVDSGVARGAEPTGARPGDAKPGVAESDCAEPGGAESEGAEPWGAAPERAEPGGAEPGGADSGGDEPAGAEPRGVEPGGAEPERAESGGPPVIGPVAGGASRAGAAGGAAGAAAAGGASGAAGGAGTGGAGTVGGPAGVGAAGGAGAAGPGGARTGGTGAAGAGGAARVEAVGAGAAATRDAARAGPVGGPRAGGTVGVPASPLPGPSPYSGPTCGLTERREPESRPASLESRPASLESRPVRTGRRVPRQRPPPVPSTQSMTLHPSTAPHCVPLPSPPTSSLPALADPESDSLRTASPSVTRLLATVVTDPSFESTTASTLVAELVDFAAHCSLDYADSNVAESESTFVSPLSVEGECALGTDVLEDRQEEFECFADAVPHLVSMLLAPEGDPDAVDIPTPRSYAEAIEGPYSSLWQAAMDAEMASSKSTGTYVDEVPPPGANIVSGMLIFRVKRPSSSPPVFKVRYVARGFSQRQGVDYFQTFSPTPKMTTLRVLLHVPAQRDYELHSLDFSTAFLQSSLHEEIWLRRPPGFTGSFPAGTQWSLRRPVYGLQHAPREWHDTLRTTLAALGFAPSTADPSLFLRTDATLPPFYVLVYVDELVLATADTEALAHVKSELQKRHTCTDLVLQRFGFTYSSPQSTPLPTGHSHSTPPSDESVEPSGLYPELVVYLMYLMTCTRPDLAYPLSILARYVSHRRHKKEHMDAAKRVLRYLCSTSGMGLVLGGRARVVLTGHADASWELHWLTYLLTDLGEAPRSPLVLYVDNKAMLALCQEHRVEHRTKHIALR
ncbi:unnamed protein product [Closterium sp. NIES-54]